MGIQAVIFDLDGVIVSTDEYHFLAWKAIADREGIEFTREINEQLRGVSRMESLEILLRKAARPYSAEEKLALAADKNSRYRELLNRLSPADILPGVDHVIEELKLRGVRIAIGSSSKNTPIILEKIGLKDTFDAVADGNDIQNSKPDPEVFLVAAQKLGEDPAACVVVEDAYAGLEAAKRAGMKAVGVGFASGSPLADYAAPDLAHADLDQILALA